MPEDYHAKAERSAQTFRLPWAPRNVEVCPHRDDHELRLSRPVGRPAQLTYWWLVETTPKGAIHEALQAET